MGDVMGDVASFIAFCFLSFATLRQSWGTIIAFIEQPEVIDLPVPGTADREDPDPPRPLACPGA